MKHLLLLIALLAAVPELYAQKPKATEAAATLPVDPDTKQVSYSAVVEAPSTTKDQLYERALEWMTKTYQSDNDVVQIKDKQQGKLVAKGYTTLTQASGSVGMAMFGVMPTPALFLEQTHTLYLKDGRYKYVLTDLALKSANSRDLTRYPLDASKVPLGFTKKSWAAALTKADEEVKARIASLNQAMLVNGKNPSDF
ncbi:DUF4468 domain-containing protein [Hymenobacter sp. BT523]|uniref:DUF4468 domain-containing protein n=1 Tax=Hymenobacter sp. BT523 TaxID=2795725 RepID=UPI0018EB4788|nr:DUF4468 domain-containing protein [Hymenobacter sp. BT523]MBJ6109467.1 DUF4468 domain-containing protein [Hymenobacter sp. BT523]